MYLKEGIISSRKRFCARMPFLAGGFVSVDRQCLFAVRRVSMLQKRRDRGGRTVAGPVADGWVADGCRSGRCRRWGALKGFSGVPSVVRRHKKAFPAREHCQTVTGDLVSTDTRRVLTKNTSHPEARIEPVFAEPGALGDHIAVDGRSVQPVQSTTGHAAEGHL